MRRGRTLIARAAAALIALLPAPLLADGLVDNVNGYTFGADGRVTRFTGLLIDKEGKVARLLEARDKRPERLDFRLDAQGRTLLPGLVDSHGRLMALGLAAVQLDLSAAATLAEAQAKLVAYAAANPQLRWIIGRGWDGEKWGLGRLPAAADLDAAVVDRPVWIEHADGHAGLANGAALAAAGIDAKTAAPYGGRIEKGAGGRPTGLFVDAAMALVTRFVPAPLPRDRDAALAKAQDLLLAQGITATADMGTTNDDWNALRRLSDAGRLRLRVIAYAAGIDPLIGIAGAQPTGWLYGDRLRMVGVRFAVDGTPPARGAWLKADYADAPGERGLQQLDDAKLRNLMSRAAMDGFQVALDAAGDAANTQALDAIEELAETYKGDRRWRVEGAMLVDPADVPRFGRNGIILSLNPAAREAARSMIDARFGPGRPGAEGAWAAVSGPDARIAFGSRYPAYAPQPFAAVAAAIESGRAAGQAFTVGRALAASTVGGAFAAFAEDRIGSLAPGRQADFILIDRDVMVVPPADIRAARVMESWIGGKRAWVRR